MLSGDDLYHQRTLILGEVNTGKTRATIEILRCWVEINPTPLMTVLDLAPVRIRGIGWRLTLPTGFTGRYRFADIVAPRLTGRDAAEISCLAAANAKMIAPLLHEIIRKPHPILIINDVTLYLQAGDDGLLKAALQSAETVLANAYYGDSFADHPISQRERRLTDRLMADFDEIIWMPEGNTAD